MGRPIRRSDSTRASAAAAARTSSADSGLGRLIMSITGDATARRSASKCGRRQPVHPHDDDLAGRALGGLPQEGFECPARVGLPALLHRVLQIERERVGVAGQGLREELGPRGGHEELAAHEEVGHDQITTPAPRSRSISASG